MPACFCHEVIGIFDTAVVGTRAQLGRIDQRPSNFRSQCRNPRGSTARCDYVRLRIPCDYRLRARAAAECAT